MTRLQPMEAEIPSTFCTADNRSSKANAAAKDHAGKDRGRLLVENCQTETEQDTKGEIEEQRNPDFLTRSRNQPEG